MAQRVNIALYDQAPDRIPQDAPAEVYNQALNVSFKNGEAVRVSPDSAILPGASTVPRVCIYYDNPATRFWCYANETGIYVHDGISETDITPVSGWTLAYNPATVYTACILGNIVYFNASDRPPVYWDGNPVNPAVALPDWPVGETCYALRSHKAFLFAVGILQNEGQTVRWSDAAEPGTVPQHWTPDADNLAGFISLTDTEAPCLDGRTLRDSFLIYKSEGIYSFDFIGGNDVFQNRQVMREHGVRTTNAITGGIDDVHLFLSAEGSILLTDGVQTRDVLDGKAQRTFYADLNASGDNKISAVTLSREKAALIFYASSVKADETSADKAVYYNFEDGATAFRGARDVTCAASGAKPNADAVASGLWDNDSEAWSLDTTIWDYSVPDASIEDVVTGRVDGFFVLGDGGADAPGEEITALLEKQGISMGNPQAHKLVSRVWPKLLGVVGDTVEFRFGSQEITNGPISLSPAVTYTIGQDMHIDMFTNGRFFYMEAKSVGGSSWRLGSIDFEFRETGLF